ncbi:hypothetical protein [Protofrankia symbiont of Coriaria ruscifolia]|uniref:hypothetical protein n=1 Tax=Protofrankia symbiont of Coriaria ruscifolia TaxID=1306542 RepID=UPI001041AB19|nr:hypothetical protein [Protofrankia symbiont of Coriaria ruscifolia]
MSSKRESRRWRDHASSATGVPAGLAEPIRQVRQAQVTRSLTEKISRAAGHVPTDKIPVASSAVADRAGKAVTQAAARAGTVSGRAGRQIDRTRSAAELAAQRARHATELQLARTRSRRAADREEKVRVHAEKTQSTLEQQLARAEHKLQRIHRRRRRGITAIMLVGAGAGATVAARAGIRQTQPAEPLTAPAAPTPGLGTESSGTGQADSGNPRSESPRSENPRPAL